MDALYLLLHVMTLFFVFFFLFFVKAPEFPEFTAKVEEAISSLGGSVFPKLNWSAPRVRMLAPKIFYRCYHTDFYFYFWFILMHWKVEETRGSDKGVIDDSEV